MSRCHCGDHSHGRAVPHYRRLTPLSLALGLALATLAGPTAAANGGLDPDTAAAPDGSGLAAHVATDPTTTAPNLTVDAGATAPAPPPAATPAGTGAAPAQDASPAVPVTRLPGVEVLTQKRRETELELSPSVGTTIYSVDQPVLNALPQGQAASFSDVMAQLPGVSQDSKASGSLHVREDHGDVQYRLNGLTLPAGISGFGEDIDLRLVDSLDFLTGALPAQYGLRTAGIIDVHTHLGGQTPGGEVGLLVGGHDDIQPSAQAFGSAGAFGYFVGTSATSSSEGIENPLPTRQALHDQTRQNKTFGDLSYDLSDTGHIGLVFGTYEGSFQIPNNPGQTPAYSLAGITDVATGLNRYPSTDLNENQTEENRFAQLSWQDTIGKLDYQFAYTHQYAELHYRPDLIGDLVYLGVASDILRTSTSDALQADAAYRLNSTHTLRWGAQIIHDDTTADSSSQVFPVDAAGMQTSTLPLTINQSEPRTGDISSLYVQDEWHLSPHLTVNYGLRFDHAVAFVDEHQLSPRLNLAYEIVPGTALHAGYARYFTPPPQELASEATVAAFSGTSNAPAVAQADPVRAERTNYFDIGITHRITHDWTVAIDAYDKDIRNLLDEGQFGQALILSPFNYARGYARGLELSTNYNLQPLSLYLNVAYGQAKGEDIVSGQDLFGADELAYIANHYVYLDHNQTYTLSGGATYDLPHANALSTDFTYGSGLRRTPVGGPPNGAALPAYTVVNASLTHTFPKTDLGTLEGRLSVVNLFDKTYLLRDGTGVGVGAPQYGLRRTFYAGVSLRF